MQQSKLIASIVLVGLTTTFGPSAFAADFVKGSVTGSSFTEISRFFENKGYVIEEIEQEGEKIEVEIKKGADKYEAYIDQKTGSIVKLEKKNEQK